MHLTNTLTLLTTLLISLTTATKLSSSSFTTTTTPSSTTKQAIATSTTSSSPPSNPSACPRPHASKQCCTSINGITKDIVDELGGILPWVSGVKVSSIVGLQCTGMKETEPNANCGDSVMCCSGSSEKTSGTQSLLKSECLPYNEALQAKKEAKEESTTLARYLDALESASAVATPTSGAVASSTAAASSSGLV